jgi:hypothetical protein
VKSFAITVKIWSSIKRVNNSAPVLTKCSFRSCCVFLGLLSLLPLKHSLELSKHSRIRFRLCVSSFSRQHRTPSSTLPHIASYLLIKHLRQNHKGYPKVMSHASCKALHALDQQDIYLSPYWSTSKRPSWCCLKLCSRLRPVKELGGLE